MVLTDENTAIRTIKGKTYRLELQIVHKKEKPSRLKPIERTISSEFG